MLLLRERRLVLAPAVAATRAHYTVDTAAAAASFMNVPGRVPTGAFQRTVPLQKAPADAPGQARPGQAKPCTGDYRRDWATIGISTLCEWCDGFFSEPKWNLFAPV